MPKNCLHYLTLFKRLVFRSACERAMRTLKVTLLIISKALDISSVMVKNLDLSDNFCVFFDLLITLDVQLSSVAIKKRCINESTSAVDHSYVPNHKCRHLTLKISNDMDVLAPVKMTFSKQKAPWRNTLVLKTLKRECRKAECKLSKTILTSNPL